MEQAYISADLGGPTTYVQLPKELWSPEMHKMRCSVVQLEKALYGHKNSGAYWNECCDIQCRKAGFLPAGGNWPSVYWHPDKHQLLIVYVDDLLLSGPSEYMVKTWEELGKLLRLAKPPGDDDDTHTFLGCTNTRSSEVFYGKLVECVTLMSQRR